MTPPPLPLAKRAARPAFWPYLVGFGFFGALAAVYVCYRKMTDPVPLSQDDTVGPMAMMLIYLLMVVFIIVCGVVGALFGLAVRYFAIRFRSRPPREP